MPNYCDNLMIVKGDFNSIQNFLHTYIPDADLTFNAMVPEPETPEECMELCPECYLKDAEAARQAGISQDDNEKPWFDWYTFHTQYWGTKWDAMDTVYSINDDSTEITISYFTAWGPADQAIGMLIDLHPELEIVNYFYEGGMCFAGQIDVNGMDYTENTYEVKQMAETIFGYEFDEDEGELE